MTYVYITHTYTHIYIYIYIYMCWDIVSGAGDNISLGNTEVTEDRAPGAEPSESGSGKGGMMGS